MKKKYLDVVYGKNQNFLENLPYAKKLANYLFSEKLKLIINNETKKKPLLLDLGCGKGLQALAFSSYFDISGLDLSLDAKNIFENQNKIIDLKTADFETDIYPFEDNKFDVVFSKSVIEHINNTNHFLGEASRVLKDNGKIIVMCPAWETQGKHFYDDYTHVKPFTALGLDAALRAAGFRDVEVVNFYQLPFVWKIPALKIICKIISVLPDSFKWRGGKRNNPRKFIRFSKETMLLGIASR